MDLELQKIIDLANFQRINNKVIVDKTINIDGENFKNNNGNFDFESEYIYKVSDEFPRGEAVFKFYNFDNLNIKNLIIEGNLKQEDTIFKSGEYVLTNSDKWEETIQPLWISNSNNLILENLISTNNSGCGISSKSVANVAIKNCVVTNCYQHGIFVGSSDNKVLIDNCRCTGFGDLGYEINKNIGGIGILVSESNNPIISNNMIIGFSDTATKTEGCNHVQYINNYIDSFGKDGIKIMGYKNNVINIEDCKVIHNYVSNRFNGRSNGSAYILFHEVTNGIIDGNVLVKNIINDTSSDVGISINLLDGNSSKNIKVINNTIEIDSNSVGISVGSKINNGIEDIVIESNKLNRNILIDNINKISIINNNITISKYLDTKMLIINSSDLIIDSNKIIGFGKDDYYDTIYIQPNSCKYIKITNNIVENCGGRFLRITEGSSDKKIEFLDIKGNRAEFALGNISYPACGIYLGMENTTISECNLINNSFTNNMAFELTSLYWVHPYKNFNVELTRLENLTQNKDNAITNLSNQYGRVIGEIYSSVKPTYTIKFKAYDEINNINPTLNNTKWVFDGKKWIAK